MTPLYTIRPVTHEVRSRATGHGTEISPFRANWSSTLSLLERELRALGARDTVLMIDVDETDLRMDGMLRANARPHTPLIGLAFEARKKGSLLFTCGRFRHWQDNVRGVALGLEALRKVERYGIVRDEQQYEGWRQLPQGDVFTQADDPDVRAWKVIADAIGVPISHAQLDPKTSYRLARKATHPDQGGTAAAFRAVEAAGRILRL